MSIKLKYIRLESNQIHCFYGVSDIKVFHYNCFKQLILKQIFITGILNFIKTKLKL